MRSVIVAAVVLLCSALAYAEPVYLECTLGSEKEKENVSIKVVEDTGKITHTRQNGTAFNTEGFFSADKISYQNVTSLDRGGLLMTEKYEIDRTTLDVKRSFHFKATDPRIDKEMKKEPIETNGRCRIVKPKKDRKI